jgi:hypothetical protein
MKKIVTIGLWTFLSIFTGRAYAQAAASHDKATDPVTIAVIELVVVLGALYFLLPKNSKGEVTAKKNNYVGLIVFGFILLAMMTSNPSLEDHRQAVMEELESKISNSSSSDRSDNWEQLGAKLGESIGKIFLDRAVARENFLLFSITTITIDNSKKDIGFGIFGKVWLYHNLN